MSDEVLVLLDALEDHLVRARARIINHVMRDDLSIPKDVRADLIIVLARLNMAIRILDEVMRKLGARRGRFVDVADDREAFNQTFKKR